MITAVLFDIGGVLELVDEHWPTEWLAHVADVSGLDHDEVMARLQAAELPDTSTAEGTEALYQATLGRALGLDPEQTRNVFTVMWDHYCGIANRPMLDFAASLKGRVKLGLLSNSADGARREEEERHGYSELFSPILYSHELGLLKPDPAIFDLAAERLAEPAASIAYIDDDAESVEAARSRGLHGIRHTGNTDATIAAVTALLDA